MHDIRSLIVAFVWNVYGCLGAIACAFRWRVIPCIKIQLPSIVHLVVGNILRH